MRETGRSLTWVDLLLLGFGKGGVSDCGGVDVFGELAAPNLCCLTTFEICYDKSLSDYNYCDYSKTKCIYLMFKIAETLLVAK